MREYSPADVTLLCVDDDPANLLLLRTTLERAGYGSVLTAHSAEAALELLTSLRPDLIISDIMMPDKDGYTLCAEIHEVPELSTIPVIFLSALQREQDRLRAFQAGAVAFINKPLELPLLLQTLQQHLRTSVLWETRLRSEDAVTPEHPDSPAISTAEIATAKTATESQESHPHEQQRAPRSLADFKLCLLERLALSSEQVARLRQVNSSQLYSFGADIGLDSEQLARMIADFTGYAFVAGLDPEQIRLAVLPATFAGNNLVLPITLPQGRPGFVLSNPFNLELMDILQVFRQAEYLIADPIEIQTLLNHHQRPAGQRRATGLRELSDLEQELHSVYGSHFNVSADEAAELREITDDSPLISRLVNRIIDNAHHLGASDIHIEPREHEVLIRYRVDGILHDIKRLEPSGLIRPLVSRLKIMSRLNIAEHRLPQDGRIVFKHYSPRRLDIDLRLSIVPSQHGECAVMRILDKARGHSQLSELGFSEQHLALYQSALERPYGLILNAGPTGSGKTTTLYAGLQHLNYPERKILTVEDPIEFSMPGIIQVEIQPEIGLNFSRALRSFLRQDPDVILVGEIRDQETARIAVEAALTGHLVLSTLHTNDAPATITRLIEMGIQPFMISSSLMLICSQRLLRRLCSRCREAYTASPAQKSQLGIGSDQPLTLYRPHGCAHCNGRGYHGRIGIHELLVPNDALRELLSSGHATTETIRNLALNDGLMHPLQQDAFAKVLTGLCYLEDVLVKVQ